MHFGEHVTLDGYGCSIDRLESVETVTRFLKELPAFLGMNILAEPSVFKAESNGEKDPGGWTGFVVIQESHISVHTFPARRFVSADVYTCKNGMDVEYIKNYISNLFDIENLEMNFLKRGTRYPPHDLT